MAATFAEHKVRIAAALDDEALSIEHIGSTAVPGCDAKPIIDILMGRAPDARFDDWRERLSSVGLSHAREDSTSQDEGQWFFRDPPRTVHVHVYDEGSDAQCRHLWFRDALRARPALVTEYIALKRSLAAQDLPERQTYVDAKGPFVRNVEALRPVPPHRPHPKHSNTKPR